MDIHNNFIKRLSNYTGLSEEGDVKERFFDFLTEDGLNAYNRTNLKRHVTASSWVTNADNTKALLIHHRKLDIWVQPGGHCDGDPDTYNVSLNELNEETGLGSVYCPIKDLIFDLDIHTIPQKGDVPEHEHYDVRYWFSVQTEDLTVSEREIKDYRWISKDISDEEIEQYYSGVARMIKKWKYLNERHIRDALSECDVSTTSCVIL